MPSRSMPPLDRDSYYSPRDFPARRWLLFGPQCRSFGEGKESAQGYHDQLPEHLERKVSNPYRLW